MQEPISQDSKHTGQKPDMQIDLFSPEIHFDSAFAHAVATTQFALKQRWLGEDGHALPPHISLGGAVDIDVPALQNVLPALLESSPQFALNFSSLGLFPGGVLFTAPASSKQLLDLHHRFHPLFEQAAHGSVFPHYVPDKLVPHTTLATGLRTDQIEEAVRVACEALSLPHRATVESFVLYDLPSTNSHFTQRLTPATAADATECMLKPTPEMHFLQLHFDSSFNAEVEKNWRNLARITGNETLLTMAQPPHLTLAGTEAIAIDQLAHELPGLAAALRDTSIRFGSIGMFPQPGAVFLRAIADSSLIDFHQQCQEVFQKHSETAPYLYYTGDHFVPNVSLLAGQNSVAQVARSASESLQNISLPLVAHASRLALVHSPSGAIRAEVSLS